ncbi:hypothetical protein P0D75_16975 [Paraburkholderia sediminicola]|uniref:hypothetical protein n=1 Tax=Paraburkholderia sediminicola TaxID=458836 RepID=UPI000E733CFE
MLTIGEVEILPDQRQVLVAKKPFNLVTSDRFPVFRPAFDGILAQAERDGNTTEQIALLYSKWEHQFGSAAYPAAKQTADRANAVAIGSRDYKGALHSDRLRAQTEHYLGNHSLSWDLANHVLDNVDVQLPLRYNSWVDRRVSMRIILARILWMRGCADQALAMVHEVLDIASKGQSVSLYQTICFAAFPVAMWRGDIDYARSLVEQLIAHATTQSILQWRNWGLEYRFALQQLESPAVPSADRRGMVSSALDVKQGDMLATIADACVTDAVLARVEPSVVGWCGPEVLRRSADRLFEAQGAPVYETVEARLNQSLHTALDQGAHGWALRSAMSLARLKMSTGAVAEAGAVLSSVYSQFSEGFETKDLREARALLAYLNQSRPVNLRMLKRG